MTTTELTVFKKTWMCTSFYQQKFEILHHIQQSKPRSYVFIENLIYD